jgi:hypothetical protein
MISIRCGGSVVLLGASLSSVSAKGCWYLPLVGFLSSLAAKIMQGKELCMNFCYGVDVRIGRGYCRCALL